MLVLGQCGAGGTPGLGAHAPPRRDVLGRLVSGPLYHGATPRPVIGGRTVVPRVGASYPELLVPVRATCRAGVFPDRGCGGLYPYSDTSKACSSSTRIYGGAKCLFP